jgi:Ca-activated chloride channel family protein
VTDIDVQWPSGVVVDSYPSVVPDLYLGEPITIKARASGAVRSGDVVRIVGNSVAGAWSSELALAGNTQNAGIGALWARARIAELLDQARRGADEDETRSAVIEAALAHHLVSKYTSLIAVDKTPVRPAGDPLSSEQVANLMPHGQSSSAIFGFPATATNAEVLRLTGVALLLLALALMLGPGLRRRTPHELLH